MQRASSLTARLLAGTGALWIAFVLIGATGLWGLRHAQTSLNDLSQRRLPAAVQLSEIETLIQEQRSELLRAFQHAPASFTAQLHDHPITLHLDALERQRQSAKRLWEAY